MDFCLFLFYIALFSASPSCITPQNHFSISCLHTNLYTASNCTVALHNIQTNNYSTKIVTETKARGTEMFRLFNYPCTACGVSGNYTLNYTGAIYKARGETLTPSVLGTRFHIHFGYYLSILHSFINSCKDEYCTDFNL